MSTQWKFILFLSVGLALVVWATQFGSVQPDEAKKYTAREFLVQNQIENNAYGLYSYLIFGSPPTAEMEKRYKTAIRTYLSYATVADSGVHLSKEQLNIFYLLLEKKPPRKISKCIYSRCSHPKEDHIRWIIENYDYDRGSIILRTISDSLHYGPYIVTAGKPMSPETNIPVKQVMILDMTQVHQNLVESWVCCFLKKATGQDLGFNGSLKRLRWILLNEIEKFAEGLTEVISALVYLQEIDLKKDSRSKG